MPRTPASVVDVLGDLARALRRTSAPWYVFGAQALVIYGLPRATADVDVTVVLGDRPSRDLVATLVKSGFRTRSVDEEFIARTRVLPMLHAASGMPVDVVLGGPGLEEAFAAAARRVRIGRIVVPVATPTHLLVMKLLAGRPKDLEDARALLRSHAAEIDRAELDTLLDAIFAGLGEDSARENLKSVGGVTNARSRAKKPQKRPPRA